MSGTKVSSMTLNGILNKIVISTHKKNKFEGKILNVNESFKHWKVCDSLWASEPPHLVANSFVKSFFNVIHGVKLQQTTNKIAELSSIQVCRKNMGTRIHGYQKIYKRGDNFISTFSSFIYFVNNYFIWL